MSVLIDIRTALPPYPIEKEDLLRFYSRSVAPENENAFLHKLNFLSRKTLINKRHSCIPDFNGRDYELYKNNNYLQSVEERMAVYKQKAPELASRAIEELLQKNDLDPGSITHFITVSCTGLCAPGIEFLLAETHGLQHTEKIALNFLGCYAAMKALKTADYICRAQPSACVLIVCVELCSLHYFPSMEDEDIIANLLFADGSAAALVAGEDNRVACNKPGLRIDKLGSAYIPSTFGLMTWDIGSTAFRMFLSKQIVNTIKKNIMPVVDQFLSEKRGNVDYWAVHPGGVKIVEAVRDSMGLNDTAVEDSMAVLRDNGNMSSPTILFILQKVLQKIKASGGDGQKIFSCAFGPGINIEMIAFTAINVESKRHESLSEQIHVAV